MTATEIDEILSQLLTLTIKFETDLNLNKEKLTSIQGLVSKIRKNLAFYSKNLKVVDKEYELISKLSRLKSLSNKLVKENSNNLLIISSFYVELLELKTTSIVYKELGHIIALIEEIIEAKVQNGIESMLKLVKITSGINNLTQRNLKITQIELLNYKKMLLINKNKTIDLYVKYSSVYYFNYFNKLITKLKQHTKANLLTGVNAEIRFNLFDLYDTKELIINTPDHQTSDELIMGVLFKILKNTVDEEAVFLVDVFNEKETLLKIFGPTIESIKKRFIHKILSQTSMRIVIGMIMVCVFVNNNDNNSFLNKYLFAYLKDQCLSTVEKLYYNFKKYNINESDTSKIDGAYLRALSQILSVVVLAENSTKSKVLMDIKMDMLDIFNNVTCVNTNIEKLILKTTLLYPSINMLKKRKILNPEINNIFQTSITALLNHVNQFFLINLNNPIITKIQEFNNKLKNEITEVKNILYKSLEYKNLLKIIIKQLNEIITKEYTNIKMHLSKSNITVFKQLVKPSELLIDISSIK